MKRALDSGTVLMRSPDVIAVHVGSVLVLHDPRSDSYMRVNASGELLWERLAGACTVGELAAALAERYDLPAHQAEADVQRITAVFVARGLLMSPDDVAWATT